jgi:predicted transcriptional regulator
MAKRRKSTDEKLLESYESGKLVSTEPTKAELEKYRDAARAVMQGIARGEDAVDEGRTASHAEAKRRLSRWLK